MAYRSLPRPSSPHDAKASIVCPYTLSKKLLELAKSRYVVILFNSKLSVVKEQTHMALSRMGNSGAVLIGGGSRIRTGDMLLAKQPLYQLSYTPEGSLVGLTRIELVTSSLSGTRSNQLSY